MRGHIQLGPTVEELEDFLLVDPVQRVRSRFNPLAPKLGQGAVQFNDYTSHEYWEISNWAKGIGYNADAGVEGGYLYGEVDSRAGSEFILPPLLFARTAENNSDTSPSVINVDDGFSVEVPAPAQVGIKFFMDVPGPIYVYMDSQGVVSADICVDAGGEPGAILWSGAANSDPSSVVKEWTLIDNDFIPTPGTAYWLVLRDDDGAFTMHTMLTSQLAGDLLSYDGSAWGPFAESASYAPYIAGAGQLGSVVAAQTVNDDLFVLKDTGDILKWNKATQTFDVFASTSKTSHDMQLWYGSLIVSHDAIGFMDSVDAATGVITPLDVNGKLLTVWNGYLWKSIGNIASYSGEDIAIWTDVECGPDDYEIRGISGLGDDIIVSTDQALWRIAPGDWIFGMSKWAYQSSHNGRNMINNQGVAFVPADNALIRIQTNAPLINIWKRDEALPSNRAGIIQGVIGTNKEVIVSINPSDAGGESTFWSFNNQGWHHVGKLPPGQRITHMHYDNSNDSIWVFSDSGHAYSFYASSTSSNPNDDALTTFMPTGWVDMGNFHSGLQTVIKDFDGVQVVGEAISPSKPVTVFWRDPDGSTIEFIYQQDGQVIRQQDGEPLEQEISGWSELGKITESGGELRWTDWETRPVGYGLHLAYSIETNDVSVSPEIYAVVVKFTSHIVDQQRFQLPIIVSNEQEMVDGTRDTRTAAQIMKALEALEFDRYLPIWYRDVDERLYECKVSGFAERVVMYEKIKGGSPSMRQVVDLTLQETGSFQGAE